MWIHCIIHIAKKSKYFNGGLFEFMISYYLEIPQNHSFIIRPACVKFYVFFAKSKQAKINCINFDLTQYLKKHIKESQ